MDSWLNLPHWLTNSYYVFAMAVGIAFVVRPNLTGRAKAPAWELRLGGVIVFIYGILGLANIWRL